MSPPVTPSSSLPSSPPVPAEISPEQRRAANRLGLILGLVCLGVMLCVCIGIALAGLPKDPKLAARSQLRDPAAPDSSAPAPSSPAPSSPAP